MILLQLDLNVRRKSNPSPEVGAFLHLFFRHVINNFSITSSLKDEIKCAYGTFVKALNHVGLISFVFVIGLTERAVLASYTMIVPACLHDQCTGVNSQSELVIPNWL